MQLDLLTSILNDALWDASPSTHSDACSLKWGRSIGALGAYSEVCVLGSERRRSNTPAEGRLDAFFFFFLR